MTGEIDETVDEQTQAADQIGDELILMAVLLARFSARTSRMIEQEMRALTDELVRLLVQNDFTQVRTEAGRSQRLKRLLEECELALKDTFGATGRALIRDIRLALQAAGDHAAKVLNDVMGFFVTRAPDEDRVMGLMGILLIEGKSAIEWWKKLAGDAKFRLGQIIQAGYQRKLGLEEMIAAIRGTAEKSFNDSVLGITWRAAGGLAKNAIAAAAASAQKFIWNANPDVIRAVQHISRLDLRTSTICQGYSQKIFSLPDYEPVGHKLPYNGGTPRHFGCRSFEIPVLVHFDKLSARFQTKIAFQRREGIFNGAEMTDLPYEDWLKTQSPQRQKAALGGRFNIWKAGEISLEDMLDQSGHPISIRELRKLAGLD